MIVFKTDMSTKGFVAFDLAVVDITNLFRSVVNVCSMPWMLKIQRAASGSFDWGVPCSVHFHPAPSLPLPPSLFCQEICFLLSLSYRNLVWGWNLMGDQELQTPASPQPHRLLSEMNFSLIPSSPWYTSVHSVALSSNLLLVDFWFCFFLC